MGLAETIIKQGIEGALLVLILVLCYKIYRLELECLCCNKNMVLRTNYAHQNAPIQPFRHTNLSTLSDADSV